MHTAAAVVARSRELFDSGATRPLAWRLEQLGNLRRMLTERGGDFAGALLSDLGKHRSESQLTEIGFVTAEAAHLERHLAAWLRPRRVDVPLAVRPARAWTELTPLGVVLVIGPWNYPVQLTLAPLAGAIAAGNTVVLKPSEHAPATSAALARWVPEYLGGAARWWRPAASLTPRPCWRNVSTTSSSRAGKNAARVVMRAARRTPHAGDLELGGRCPAYVDGTADLATTARRIAWGRFVNAGQTCVAPDYVLATPGVLDALEPQLVRAITSMFGTDPSASASYGRIVDDRHFARLAELARRQHGGPRRPAGPGQPVLCADPAAARTRRRGPGRGNLRPAAAVGSRHRKR